MRAFLRLFLVCGVLGFCFNPLQAAPAATNPPTGFRLIIELQDGSKIIGKNGDDNFQFRSDVLGEMKLPLERIRSIACQPKTNSVQLATANGDTLTAQFVTKVVRVETAFGGVKLPVNLIRHMQVSPAGIPGHMPSGLVSWWRAEGNANDSISGNNGTPIGGLIYTNGEVGQAFNFDGIDATVSVPASPSLDVGTGQGFTLECWIAPTSVAGEEPLMEWRGNGGNIHNGAHFWLSVTYGEVGGAGCIYANIVDSVGGLHIFASPTGIVKAGILQHVALTYDKASGVGKIYYNGSLVASNNLGSFTPKTDTALLLGARIDFGDVYYQGVIDEPAIFNRALSASEIQADYESGKGSNQ
jgi:hypothetical protein